MINQKQFIKDKLEEAINEVVFAIDGILLPNPEAVIYVYEGFLKIIKERSSLPKHHFKSKKAPEISVKTPAGVLYPLTSYEERNLLTYLFKDMKYEGYKYEANCYDQFLPSSSTFAALGLLRWGVRSVVTPRLMVDAIISMNAAFKLLVENTPSAHCIHVTTFGKDEFQDKVDNYYSNVINDTTRFWYHNANYILVFSDTHYLFAKEDKTSRRFETGLIEDNDTLIADDIEFIASHDGLTTLQMRLFGDITFDRENIRERIYNRESKQKPKKK
ncbi:hypothetical protein V4100_001021 [Pseudomonas aeruginosa]